MFFNSQKGGSVTVEEAYKLGQVEGSILIDVREADEYKSGASPFAVNIPLSTFDINVRDRLSKYKEVYVMCRSGGRSAQAVKFLKSIGINAIDVSGGIIAWKSKNLPVT